MLSLAEFKQAISEPAEQQPVNPAVWDGREGSYWWRSDDETRVIYPKRVVNGKVESMRVVIPKVTLTLMHDASRVEVKFSHYKHQSRWLWKDSREDRSFSNEENVIRQVTRMLFAGDRAKATEFVFKHLTPPVEPPAATAKRKKAKTTRKTHEDPVDTVMDAIFG